MKWAWLEPTVIAVVQLVTASAAPQSIKMQKARQG